MKAKIKILILFLLLISTAQTQAASLRLLDFKLPVPPSSFWEKIKICRWNISCYFQTPLGVSLTTINATDLISASRTTINDNFTNLNNGKIENSSSSIAAITTLGNLTTAGSLVTIGTITSGTWNGDEIGVAYGGMGTTSPSLYRVLLGNAAGGITVASSTGSSGQLLQSAGAGAYPIWATVTTDEGASYNWTGAHTFFGSATSSSFHATSTITVNGNATTTSAGNFNLQGDILAVGSATTTNLAVTSHATTSTLTVSNDCIGCVKDWERKTASVSLDTTDDAETSLSVNCTAGNELLGGGFNGLVADNTAAYLVEQSGPTDDDTWTVVVHCTTPGAAACSAGTLTVQAICADVK